MICRMISLSTLMNRSRFYCLPPTLTLGHLSRIKRSSFLSLRRTLWQARLGHCDKWQLKVLHMSADCLPSCFYPHPFASYGHYNQTWICKRPATRGKHPYCAVTRQQRFYMDASQFNYSCTGKKSNRVVLLCLMGITPISRSLMNSLSLCGFIYECQRNLHWISSTCTLTSLVLSLSLDTFMVIKVANLRVVLLLLWA